MDMDVNDFSVLAGVMDALYEVIEEGDVGFGDLTSRWVDRETLALILGEEAVKMVLCDNDHGREDIDAIPELHDQWALSGSSMEIGFLIGYGYAIAMLDVLKRAIAQSN